MQPTGFQTQTQDPFAAKLAQRQAAIQQSSQKQTGGHYAHGIGGFFQKALPIIGGAAGAIAGIPLDPFTAGMASVVLGGAGSAGGQAIENASTGQKVLQGNVLEQGALGAVPGGLGKVADIGRAAKGGAGILDSLAATKAIPSTIGRTADTNTGGLLGQAKGNLNNKFQQLEAGAGGSNAGAKLPGAPPSGISLQKSQDLAALHEKYNIPAASPETKLKYIQQHLNQVGPQIDQKLAQSNVPLTAGDKQAIMGEFQNRVAQEPNAQALQSHAANMQDHFLNGGPTAAEAPTIGGQPISMAELAKFGFKNDGQTAVNDLAGMNAYKQKLDSLINYGRSSGAPDPLQEQAATLMRQTLNDQVGKYAPDVAVANKQFSELKQLESPLLIENNRLQQTQGGLYSRLVNNNVVRGAEAKVGNIGQRLTGGAPSIATGTPSGTMSALTGGNIAKKLGSQTAVRAVAGGVSPQQSQQQPSAGFPQLTIPTAGGSDQTQAQSGNPSISPDQLVQLIAADPTHETLYTSLYNTLNKANSSDATAGLTTGQKNQLAGSQTALSSLQDFGNQIVQAGGGKGPAAGSAEALLGRFGLGGQNAADAYALQQQRVDTASTIAAALSPTGRPTASITKMVSEGLPTAADSAAVVQSKINLLAQRIQDTMKQESVPVGQLVNSLQGG